MVKKLNSMPDFRARMPKQPHDLSRSFAFTSSVGMELPYFQHMCHPHDELFFSTGAFTRINPILLPSLAQVDFHLDYFFVPLTVMYTPANVLHYGTDDLISSVFAGTGSDGLRDKFPVFSLNNTFEFLNQQYVTEEMDWRSFNSLPTPAGSTTNGFYSAGQSAYRLLDMLGYNPDGIFLTRQDLPETFNPTITPWFLAAYQACHQLYFRNDDREKKDYCYNFDTYFNANDSEWLYDSRDIDEENTRAYLPLLALRYRSRYKDYFNSVKVSPLSSGTSLREFYDNDGNPVSSNQFLQGVRQFLGISPSTGGVEQFGNFANNDASALGKESTNVVYDAGDNLSTASLRAMFALEKLVRVVGRANKDYESQVLAHFGVKVPHDVMHNITHIAHDMFSLRPETVTSTASTDGAQLGEVGGQGQVSFSGQRHKFTAPCHGVFMAILSSIPRMRYEAGFDKSLVFNERLDFWQPEFDRLGMQPLYAYEALRNDYTLRTGRVGWQFGYEHLKRKYDRISMAFHEAVSNSFAPWVLTQRPYIGMGVPGQAAASAITNLDYTNFLVQPRDLDKIMSVKVNWGWSNDFVQYPWAMYYTDNFIHDFGFNCTVVNFMSEYGEPELDV